MNNLKNLRHPHLRNKLSNPSPRKPKWLRVRAPISEEFGETLRLVRDLGLNTVCEEASCPNIGECWSLKHATVMILGDICTRACSFCDVRTGKPGPVNHLEPENVGIMAKKLNLRHIVITSVDRDDLPDGGATQFVECVKQVHAISPNTTVEILTPDFRGKNRALEIILTTKPDVFNHNLETVPRLYSSIRPGARYETSLDLLRGVKKRAPEIFTKSGIMLGFGEERGEVIQVMGDMLSAGVEFLTIGQYLQPTPKHAEIIKYVSPEEFHEYNDLAKSMGFLNVSASPLTRSSYHADEEFSKLKNARLNKKGLL